MLVLFTLKGIATGYAALCFETPDAPGVSIKTLCGLAESGVGFYPSYIAQIRAGPGHGCLRGFFLVHSQLLHKTVIMIGGSG